MTSRPEQACRQLVVACRRLYQRGFIVGTEGNVSVRVAPDRLWITPAGCHKGLLRTAALLLVDLEGAVQWGQGRPSSEMPLHLALYRGRPDVAAVIHAHPPLATALTVAGYRLETTLVPEAVVLLGEVPTVPYQMPSTWRFAHEVSVALQHTRAALLENHGSVAIGASLQDAFNTLETVERVAQLQYLARTLGRVQPLPAAAVAALRALRQR